METGANKPIHSLIDTTTLDSQSIDQDCHLSIQIGLNGFSFCIRNNAEVLALESYHNSLSQLEGTIENNKWLHKEYASTNVSISTKKHTLVPSSLYKNEDKKKYLELNHVRTDQLDVLADEVKAIDSFNVYGISKAEQDIITTFFPKSTVNHFSSSHIPNMLLKHKNVDGQNMIVNIDYKQMHITVIDSSKLIYFNVFNYKNAHDCIYYMLFVCEQLDLNPEHVLLEFMGNVNKESELYELAYTYIRNVNFSKRGLSLSPNINSLLEHEYYPLIHQHLCE